MLVNPVQSAVISNGMISLTIGQHIELPDEVAERLVEGGIVEPVKSKPKSGTKTEGKKLTGAPENKAVDQDAGRTS